MTLEERYNAAGLNSYVGRVKGLQAAEAGSGPGVNFVDGVARSEWSPNSIAAPDVVQTEFTRNNSGDFRYGAGGKTPGSPANSYLLSRWLQKGLEKAFGPDSYYTNNRYTTVNDVRNANNKIHAYAPLPNKDFIGNLMEMSKGRVNGSPSGPAPSGLNG